MKDENSRTNYSRRRFLGRLARGAGAVGLAAAGAGCDPSTYWDYLTSGDEDKVNDRFNESVSGDTSGGSVTFTTSASRKGNVSLTFCVDDISGSLPYNGGQVCQSF